jgi:hypothetical protein
MAVTVADTVVTLGAPGDAYQPDGAAPRFRLAGFLVACGVNPGTFIVNDKYDGSGNALVTVITKSNTSIAVFPEEGFWANGGFKANASNPAGSIITAYVMGAE